MNRNFAISVAAVFLLTILQRVWSGPLAATGDKFPDLTTKERFIVLPAIALMLILSGAVILRLSQRLPSHFVRWAAAAVCLVDKILYGGTHVATISGIFALRGIFVTGSWGLAIRRHPPP